MADRRQNKTPRDIIRIVFRRKVLFLLAAALFAIIVLLGAHLKELEYTTTMQVEVRQKPSVADTASQSVSFQEITSLLTYQLKGPDAVEKCILDQTWDKGFPRDENGQLNRSGEVMLQAMVRDVMKNITVTWDNRPTNMPLARVTVNLVHREPSQARDFLNKLVDNYEEQTYAEIIKGLEEQRAFLADVRYKMNEDELDQIRKEIDKIEKEHTIPASASDAREKVEMVSRKLDDLKLQIKTDKEELDMLQNQVGDQEVPVGPTQVVKGPNPEYTDLKKQLALATEQLDALKRVLRDTHPDVKNQQELIAKLTAKLAETPEKTELSAIYGPSLIMDTMIMRINVLKLRIENQEMEIARQENDKLAYEKIEADLRIIPGPYDKLLARRDNTLRERERLQKSISEIQTQLAAELAAKRTRIKAVYKAKQEYRPTSPNFWSVLLAAVGGGMAFGAALVVLMTYMERTVTTTEDAAKYFDLPVHGVIGEIVPAGQRHWRKVCAWSLAPVTAAVVALTLSLFTWSIYLRLTDTDEYNEKFRKDRSGYIIKQVHETVIDPVWNKLKALK